MDNILNFLTKGLIDEAAKNIDRDGIPEYRTASKYVFVIGKKEYPYKLLVTEAAKIAEVDLSSYDFGSNDQNREGLEGLTGYKCINKKTERTFVEIIEQLKTFPEINKSFSFHKTNKSYVWIDDNYGMIGKTVAHYEIIKRRNKLFVELHFESKYRKQKDVFQEKIGSLSEGLEWFDWMPIKGKYTCKSIRVNGSVELNDPEVVDKLKEKLIFLEKNIGDTIRAILNEEFPDLKESKKSNNNEMKQSLNQILFGPPGTGKTYHTINKALEIIGEDPEGNELKETEIQEMDRNKLKVIYDHYVEEGQIAFTTFHQSMSYEDFVEGIKPLKPIDGEDVVKYDVVDGIFKKLCNKATETKSINNFDEAHKLLINEIIEKEALELVTPKLKSPFAVKVNSAGNCVAIPKTKKATEMVITKDMLYDYLLNNSTNDWKSYTVPIGEYLKKNFNLKIEKKNNLRKAFVLIIDEINRGNVSSIFGELITLIEEDKRLGKKEELRVVLPYSKDETNRFGVPANLYIIGTMNTADRSVEALDTALRRRFSFEEMPPKPSVIKEFGKLKNEAYSKAGILEIEGYKVDLAELLTTINQRLKILLDSDHLIGHSYFMNVDSPAGLKAAFSKQIMPLLQEYFYGDYGKISLVLGEGFCKGEKVENAGDIFADANDYETDAFNEKMVYELKDPKQMKNLEFLDAIKELLKIKKAAKESEQDAK